MASDIAQHLEAVARAVLGEPNLALSKPDRELRFGRNGSISCDLQKGTWYDYERSEGGGVLDLLQREKGLANGAALDWLRDELHADLEPRAAPAPAAPAKPKDRGRLVATYDYVDETGSLVSQTLRYEMPSEPGKKPAKRFSQRHPDGKGGWVWNLQGVRLVPYRLPELQEAIANDWIVFVVEGEKAADRLRAVGIPATCNPMGAGKWPDSFDEFFAGARVVVLPDNDAPGRAHGAKVAQRLAPLVLQVSIVDLPGLNEKEDVVEWLDVRGGTSEHLYEIVQRAPAVGEEAAAVYVPRFAPLSWPDVFAAAQSYPWLVKGIIPDREAALIYGAPQTGKSFATQDLALCVARGLPFFGRRVRRAGVVYCAFEGGRGFRKRQLAYANHHHLDAADAVPMSVLTKRADLFGDQDFDPLCVEVEHVAKALSQPLGLVVLDTWSAATPGANENASEDVSRIRAKVVAMIERFGCSVIVVHHKPAGGGKPRGHTSLTGDFETTIDVDWSEGVTDASGRRVRQAELTKQREGRTDVKWRFVLEAVELGRDEDGDPITSCVVVAADDGAGSSSAGKQRRLTDRARIGLQSLREALGSFGEPAPATLRLPYGVQVVHYERWRAIAQGKLFDPDETPTPDAVRKAIKRVGEELMVKRVIARNNPYVWIVREPSL